MPPSAHADTRLTELDLVKLSRRGDDGSFRRVAELSAEDSDRLTSPLLPGFELALSDVFAPEA